MTRVPAAARTLALLQTLAQIGQPASADRLAKRLNIPRSSCYQLLEVLEEAGFAIHYEKEKRWGLGLSAWELGSAYRRHEPLERLARPALRELVASYQPKTAVVGHLGVLDGSDVLYLLEERPAKSLKLVTDIGVRLPAHLTASGRSMLAFLETKQLNASFSNKQLATRTQLGPKNIKELLGALEVERNQGFALEVDEVSLGYASVGVAIRDGLGHPIAGIALTLQSIELGKLELAEIAKRLSGAAAETSRKFGHHG